MHVIIGGCGRVGAELADQLSDEGHDVVVLDVDDASFARIGPRFNGESLVGDVTDKDLMVRAGIERADALAAVTQSDNSNLMAVQIARQLFEVPHTVARLFNPQREASYRKMGIRYVSETSMIVAAIRSDLRTGTVPAYLGARDEEVDVVEIEVGLAGQGVSVAELERDGSVRVATVHRGLRTRIPRLDDRFREHDILVAAVRRGAERRVRALLVGD